MTQPIEHFYALIMAGGGGTRLWPLSRQATPKQNLALVDETQTMFQLTIRRLQPLLPPERVFVVTGQDLVEQLMADEPTIPAENFIVEPFGRNSGPAAAYGTMVIVERDPDAVIATLSADHFIANTERFRGMLAAASELAVEGHIVTLGISLTRPASEFGYIKRGKSLGSRAGFEVFAADDFTEKPDVETALQFLSSGLYSWNSGMFIWHGQHILREYECQQPVIFSLIQQIKADLNSDDLLEKIRPLWEKMPNISLDYAVMEGAPDVAVIPADIGWTDVGSWDLLYDVLPHDANGNAQRVKDGDHIQINTRGSLVMSDRLVVTIGVEDLVIVDTDDVILVCHRSQAQDVRKIVEKLKQNGAESYL